MTESIKDDQAAQARAHAAAMEHSRWQAVLRRSAAERSSFVYAVKTTGIYCRPGCASRRPLRANVSFFDTAGGAEAAGYRACLRCRPQESAPSPQGELVRQACATIGESDGEVPAQLLASAAGLSMSRFAAVFKQTLGVTPHQYVQAMRRSRLQDSLKSSKSITQAIHVAGYRSPGQVYDQPNDVLGMTPGDYRAGGMKQRIRYAIGACDLGRVLAAMTERGVCAIELGDADGPLVESIRLRFPAATIASDDQLGDVVDQVATLIRRPAGGLALPMDVQGTAFQQRVWRALQEIPAGESRTYGQVAAAIGKPAAVRAAAGACAKNRLAVAIPCHRVVGSRGKLTGYRWGIERKRALLGREAKQRDDQ